MAENFGQITRKLNLLCGPDESPLADLGVCLINPVMENHIKLTSGFYTNSYLRQFQVAQLNFYLFLQEEKMSKKRFKPKLQALKPSDN